jgi:hypothetical protein
MENTPRAPEPHPDQLFFYQGLHQAIARWKAELTEQCPLQLSNVEGSLFELVSVMHDQLHLIDTEYLGHVLPQCDTWTGVWVDDVVVDLGSHFRIKR